MTAERGRGKSALAGMHIQRLAGDAIVTAPSRASAEVMATFAGERFRFMAPDALLASDVAAEWLVVDEAAAIPSPLLKKTDGSLSPYATDHHGAGLRRHWQEVFY
ncbi:tRNA(Met) cytidine acetyltransferase TmcA [Kluyvera cryocrescens]|uniref:tRNA(Met) cytidine acetyltransferase TmcA n=1 Tax=Kluyvera cryocrescens TaxID=580 RepID=A0A485AUI2_KLUCR|nr:tRNA(Met) cytidine acetyltransferase TmcA [Kluyvera cryocrescens]